jgi:hypothetical protein
MLEPQKTLTRKREASNFKIIKRFFARLTPNRSRKITYRYLLKLAKLLQYHLKKLETSSSHQSVVASILTLAMRAASAHLQLEPKGCVVLLALIPLVHVRMSHHPTQASPSVSHATVASMSCSHLLCTFCELKLHLHAEQGCKCQKCPVYVVASSLHQATSTSLQIVERVKPQHYS